MKPFWRFKREEPVWHTVFNGSMLAEAQGQILALMNVVLDPFNNASFKYRVTIIFVYNAGS